MIKKLAVLVIEKADGSISLSAGEKGKIAMDARDLIRETNDTPGHDVACITALSMTGVLKQKKWKGNLPTSAPAVEAADPVETPAGDAGDDDAEGPDAEDIRAKLKEKGVKVPPRITIDNLIKLAIDNGVEV
ncbi:MAG: hypothetical protein IPO40_24740 [Fibrobacteres bacterium]|nr:hypothetical protein [Fibrobacterota bacterium]